MIYLILPAYNEEKNLLQIFKKINNLKTCKEFTVILVDDCSSDMTERFKKTKNKFKLIYLKNSYNRGLSITLENGFKIAKKKSKKNDYIITMDSDNTHPINIIPKMIRLMKKNNSDIVIASRFIYGSEVNGLNIFRKVLSSSAKLIFSILFPHRNLREYTCNFRIYRPYLISELINKKSFFKNEDFNIAVKILLFLINKFQNLKISEYPLILNYHRKIGESKMKIYRNIFLTLRLIFKKKT